MARHPAWFERLDSISASLDAPGSMDWLGRHEIQTIFQCSERDSIRLLHKFGAETRDDVLAVTRSSLLAQIHAIRRSSTYAAYVQQRRKVAGRLTAARAESRARQFAVDLMPAPAAPSLSSLPSSITWRRSTPSGPARFEVYYRDGADLMTLLAEFLSAAGVNREAFFAGTEPTESRDRSDY